MLTKREVILAKIESTYNTDPTPSASTDAVLVENPSWSMAGLKMLARPTTGPTLATRQGAYAGHLISISFDVEVKGSGTAGTAPELGVLLRACGMDETIVASTSVTYAPVSTAHESATIYFHHDGVLHKLTGGRGTVSFNMAAGDKIKASFTFTGHHAFADSALPSPSYDATTPEPIKGISFAVGGYSAVINSLSLDLGITVGTPPSVNAADGYGEVRITGRDVNGSFDPEMTTEATNSWLADFKDGTAMAMSTGVIGSTAGNRVQFSLPAIYYNQVAPGDRDGIRTYAIGYGAAESSGDDEASIAFT